jgi:two-component system response regulator YesN
MHFNEYLHSVRIEEAKKLLRSTDLKISVIALKLGYSDSDHFTSKFKAITNNLPSDYRKKHNDENSYNKV